MKTSDFDYYLPKEQIAQEPLSKRDASRLMVLDRAQSTLSHRLFTDIPEYFKSGDVLVFNNSRVIPARLRGYKEKTGAQVEILLLKRLKDAVWQALVKPAKRLSLGTKVLLRGYQDSVVKNNTIETEAEIVSKEDDGVCTVCFADESVLTQIGAMPLPPYINTPLSDSERYQTVYAAEEGSVAAPTAGLHFTSELLQKLRQKGVQTAFVRLDISLDTFRPVKSENPLQHPIHKENYEISCESADIINQAKENGRTVYCVGTSAARVLEQSALLNNGRLKSGAGEASLLILPGHKWQIVDSLITNFHLPKSTLLMLVSSFYSREKILAAYHEAVQESYRFFSFGDAMLLL